VTDQIETSSSDIVAFNEQDDKKIKGPDFPDFFYDLGTRFRGIKKEDLNKARSVIDFLPEEQTQRIVLYKSVSVIILEDDKQTDIRETGNTEILTKKQVELLQSAEYSTNLLIRADYQIMNKEIGLLENSYSTPYLTVVPEKGAVYVSGKEMLLEYLKENNRENTLQVKNNKLQAAKLYFTVSKKGAITNVNLVKSSGYPSIDKAMIELIINAPGTWEPAENYKGEKVEQELVISFGMIGC